jgi:hypothetical protein
VELNPEWETRLFLAPDKMIIPKHWSSDTDDDNRYSGEDYINRIPKSVEVFDIDMPKKMSAAQACDVFQWQLLSTSGGFFSDMDILWVRPLDPVLGSALNSDVVFCLEDGLMAIGFMGSVPDCSLFNDMAVSFQIKDNREYQHYGTSMFYRFSGVRSVSCKNRSGEVAVNRLTKRYPYLNITVISDSSVYPFDWREINDIFLRDKPVSKSTAGVHWFGGDPLSDAWNRTLTENNWQDYSNTFTRCIRCLQSKQVSVLPPTANLSI